MRMSKSVFYIIFLLTLVLTIDYFRHFSPKYIEGECSKDRLNGDFRKITRVKKYIYNYCKIVDNRCMKYYFMRIRDFDRITDKVNCKELK